MQSFFVSGCFHWIGFHIVNHLLENGYPVTGHEHSLTDQQEYLEMMVGRNDLFSLLSGDPPAKKYTHAILLNEISNKLLDPEGMKVFRLCREKEVNRCGASSIHIPLLFGEWMPMNEEGIYVEEHFIPFTSEKFRNEAVYIKDFIAVLMICLLSSYFPEKLTIRPKSRQSSETEDDRHVLYLREQRPIEQQVQTVVAHYRRFKDFYTLG